MSTASEALLRALADPDDSVRLRAAMEAGMSPSPEYVDSLVERCGVEPDFYVRDMLTWALIQHGHDQVIARVLPELDSPVAQARAQALHTLSKVGTTDVWPAVTPALLDDPSDDVARTAWRAAAALVPIESRPWLADMLATQWGRGDDDVRLHALATKRIHDDPDLAFDTALEQATRVHTLRGAPLIDD